MKRSSLYGHTEFKRTLSLGSYEMHLVQSLYVQCTHRENVISPLYRNHNVRTIIRIVVVPTTQPVH